MKLGKIHSWMMGLGLTLGLAALVTSTQIFGENEITTESEVYSVSTSAGDEYILTLRFVISAADTEEAISEKTTSEETTFEETYARLPQRQQPAHPPLWFLQPLLQPLLQFRPPLFLRQH